MKKVHIYINVSTIGDHNEVMNYLLESIKYSGLYDRCEDISIVINGDLEKVEVNEVKDKYLFYNREKSVTHYEFPILEMIWEDSITKDDEFYILYLHMKSSTRYGEEVKDWLKYMTYFNINKWGDMIDLLDDCDVCGVNLYEGSSENLVNRTITHFSGNFWWSKSSYVKNLKNPYWENPISDNYSMFRYQCEYWNCTGREGVFKSLWNSNINHYSERYPSEKYIKPQYQME